MMNGLVAGVYSQAMPGTHPLEVDSPVKQTSEHASEKISSNLKNSSRRKRHHAEELGLQRKKRKKKEDYVEKSTLEALENKFIGEIDFNNYYFFNKPVCLFK